MADDRFSSLLIDDGGLAAIAAALARPDPTRVLLWFGQAGFEQSCLGALRGRGGLAKSARQAAIRAAMVERHAARLGTRCVIDAAALRSTSTAEEPIHPTLETSRLVFEAACAARCRGIGHVIWPVQAGPDPDAICAAVDIATAAGDLVAAAVGWDDPIEFELPLVDLDLDQLVDLADDVAVPDGLFWPCDGPGPDSGERGAIDVREEEPCGSCPSCVSLRAAFERRGLAAMWP